MKIALYHNHYKLPGGEDQMFEIECRSLRKRGHEVFPFAVSTGFQMEESSVWKALQIGLAAPFNLESYRSVEGFLDEVKPDVAHVHNWFPILSPSVYKPYFDRQIPVFQTLHNYRMGCATGNFRHKNGTCTDCLSKGRWSAVKKSCYQGNPVGSYFWKRVVDQNWKNGTFLHPLLHFLCPSKEVLLRHLEMGIPREKMTLIPNACEDPLAQHRDEYVNPTDAELHVVFMGRLVPEKGIRVLVEAWKRLAEAFPMDPSLQKARLTVVGGGPELAPLQAQYGVHDGINFCGNVRHEVAMRILRSSSILVFPSLWAEPFGLGIIEAMGAGKAVIASNIGGPADLIKNLENGVLVTAGDGDALVLALKSLLSDPGRCQEMGRRGRKLYLQHYGPDVHATALERCYLEKIQTHGSGKDVA